MNVPSGVTLEAGDTLSTNQITPGLLPSDTVVTPVNNVDLGRVVTDSVRDLPIWA